MRTVLVINSGSSSLKYQLIDSISERVLAVGVIDRIGQDMASVQHTVHGIGYDESPALTVTAQKHTSEIPIADHETAFLAMLDAFTEHGPSLTEHAPVVVGHRVVHGGSEFFDPTVVTPAVEHKINELSLIAPLHNPSNLAGIRAAREAFPTVPHVAVFDTAFHQSIPEHAYTYAIDASVAEKHQVRRYGFHGTSHAFVSAAAAAFLERDGLRQIIFHLGNGASVTAVNQGRSLATSMGFTPLEGLVMGTRSGDFDPAVLFHLHRVGGYSIDELDTIVNKRSGLLGLSGYSDMRDVLLGWSEGDAGAIRAFEVYINRLKSYLGAYIAQLGGVDVISFTAGVGENAAEVRAAAMSGLEFFGIRLDEQKNTKREHGIRVISADDSAVTVLVVPTNEELEIARQALAAISK